MTEAQWILHELREARHSSWHHSDKGNLCRKHGKHWLTIFLRTWDGTWGWCIAGPRGKKRFSPSGYSCQAEAVEAVEAEVT
jgi:hypothetical protein